MTKNQTKRLRRLRIQKISRVWLLALTLLGSIGIYGQTAVTPQAGYSHAFRYSYTGANQTFTVPAGVTSIQVKAWGAGGGSENHSTINSSNTFATGAGYSSGILPVTPGEVYVIIAGQGGSPASTASTFGGGGGGGTNTGASSFNGGSGGGLSGIFLSSYTFANARLIAGGSGGVAGAANGRSGAGGGTTGANSVPIVDPGYSIATAAGGGTQSLGGTASTSGASGGAVAIGGVGSQLQGGTGGLGSNWTGANGTGAGGGGGGGYYGGGGGAGDRSGFCSPTSICYDDAPGGGGSGYLHSSITSGVSNQGSTTTRDPANNSDVHYVSGIGLGGADGSNGGNGMVIIQYLATEVCTDGIDNDADGLIDCADPDCALASNCSSCGTSSHTTNYQWLTPESGYNRALAIKYTGADQRFTVPTGVTSVKVKAWGAGGGGPYGGNGGYISGNLATTPNESLTIIVGQGGQGQAGTGAILNTTYGGGGASGTTVANSNGFASGGGRSAIRRSSTELATAGAGGGGGNANCGTNAGNGGGLTGGTPLHIACFSYSLPNLATGGTQSAGGAAGTCGTTAYNGFPGLAFTGGRGGNLVGCSLNAGGGGGGGYFGGGGGNCHNDFCPGGAFQDDGMGAGGSSYVGGLTTSVNTQGSNAAAGGNTDVHYIAGIGLRNTNTSGIVNAGNGLIVLQWNETLITNTTSTSSICLTQTKALTGTPAGGTWTIVSGGGSISGTTYTPASTGSKTIRYTASGCTADVTFTVDPTATNTTATTDLCESATRTLSGTPAGGSWSIVSGGGSISGTTYTPADVSSNTTVTIRYTANGCSADASFTVNVDAGTTTNSTSTAAICENATKSLSATPTGGSWSVLSGGGSIASGLYTPANVTTPTTVTVRYTIAANGGCAAKTADASFTVNELPTASGVTSSNPTGCGSTNGSMTIAGLTASTSYTVSYNGPSGAVSASHTSNGSGSIALTGLAAGVYSSIIVSKAGCSGATLGPVTLSNPASPVISSSSATQPVVCNGTGSIVLNGLAASTTYAVNYSSSVAGMVSVNLSTNASGMLTIPSLASATYSSIYVVLTGCASNSVGPYTLAGPAPVGSPTINCK